MLRKSEWGPLLWKFLHACTFAFPENPTREETLAFEKLIESLPKIIPCPDCKAHFTDFLKVSPPQATCGDVLDKWLVDFHNTVNKRLNKPVITLAEASQMYNTDGPSIWWTYGAIFVLGILLGLFIYYLLIKYRYIGRYF